MPVLRKEHQSKFTIISNDFLQREDVSLKAKGLLCYMLSCTDNWKFTIDSLSKSCKDGKTAIMSALDELEQLGYHKKEKIYEDGKIKEWVYYISEIPVYKDTSLDSDFLDAENLNQENRHYNKKQINNTKNNNEEKNIEEKKDSLIPISVTENSTPVKRLTKFQKLQNITKEKIFDKDVQDALDKYLRFRIQFGLTDDVWSDIIDLLKTIASTKDEALSIIEKSRLNSYKSFYPLKNSEKYRDNIQEKESQDPEHEIKQAYMKYAKDYFMTERMPYIEFKESWLKEHET